MNDWRRGAIAGVVVAALGLSLLGSRMSARVEPPAARLDAWGGPRRTAWSAPQAVARGLPSGLRRVAAGWFWVATALFFVLAVRGYDPQRGWMRKQGVA